MGSAPPSFSLNKWVRSRCATGQLASDTNQVGKSLALSFSLRLRRDCYQLHLISSGLVAAAEGGLPLSNARAAWQVANCVRTNSVKLECVTTPALTSQQRTAVFVRPSTTPFVALLSSLHLHKLTPKCSVLLCLARTPPRGSHPFCQWAALAVSALPCHTIFTQSQLGLQVTTCLPVSPHPLSQWFN